jgi:general secretion pathway protein G
MTRRDWWLGIGVLVAVILLAIWILPKRMGRATVDAATEKMEESWNNPKAQLKDERDAAFTQIGFYKTAVERFQADTKQYPTSLEELVNKPSDATKASLWGGPYLDKINNDPWGNAFHLAVPGKHNPDSFDLWSVGPDKQDGTADDIGNW